MSGWWGWAILTVRKGSIYVNTDGSYRIYGTQRQALKSVVAIPPDGDFIIERIEVQQ